MTHVQNCFFFCLFHFHVPDVVAVVFALTLHYGLITLLNVGRGSEGTIGRAGMLGRARASRSQALSDALINGYEMK